MRLVASWQFNVGINQGERNREGAFDWGQVTGHTTWGKRPTFGLA